MRDRTVFSRDSIFKILFVLIFLKALINSSTNFFLVAIFDNCMLLGLNIFFKNWNDNYKRSII